MGLAAAAVFTLQVLGAWIALQCALERMGDRVARVRPVVAAMKAVDNFALVAGTTLCALLVLLPSFVFVVLEVFRFVQVRSRGNGDAVANDSRSQERGEDPTKTITAHMERVVAIVDELDAMGERLRQAALSLTPGDVQAPAQVIVRSSSARLMAALTTPRKKSTTRLLQPKLRRRSSHKRVVTSCSLSADTARPWRNCTLQCPPRKSM